MVCALGVSSWVEKGQVSVRAVMVSKMLPEMWRRWWGLELVPGVAGTVVKVAIGGVLAGAVVRFGTAAFRGRRKNCW